MIARGEKLKIDKRKHQQKQEQAKEKVIRETALYAFYVCFLFLLFIAEEREREKDEEKSEMYVCARLYERCVEAATARERKKSIQNVRELSECS